MMVIFGNDEFEQRAIDSRSPRAHVIHIHQSKWLHLRYFYDNQSHAIITNDTELLTQESEQFLCYPTRLTRFQLISNVS